MACCGSCRYYDEFLHCERCLADDDCYFYEKWQVSQRDIYDEDDEEDDY